MRYFNFPIKMLLISAFMFIVAQNAFAQKTFEGVIKYKVYDNEKTSYVKYYSMPKKVRIEVENSEKDDEAVVILNSKKDDMTIILKSEKTAVSIPMNIDEPKKDEEKKNKNFNISRTDETKKILGYSATKYTGKGKGDEVEIWVTEDIKPFIGFGGTTGDKLEFQDIAGMEIKGFPLEFYNKTKGSSIVATSIVEEKLEESLFKAPPSYKQYNYKTFLKGLKTLTKDLSKFFKDLKLDSFSE